MEQSIPTGRFDPIRYNAMFEHALVYADPDATGITVWVIPFGLVMVRPELLDLPIHSSDGLIRGIQETLPEVGPLIEFTIFYSNGCSLDLSQALETNEWIWFVNYDGAQVANGDFAAGQQDWEAVIQGEIAAAAKINPTYDPR